MSPSDPDGQQGYWDSNIDPENLGGGFDAADFSYEKELPFYLTPDQDLALQHLSPCRGKRILDIGAGIGMNSLYFARNGATVIAIDISHERLATLRRLKGGAGIWVVKCAAEALPFRGGAFNFAYSKSVLIHTRLKEAVAEIGRVLAPDGRGAFIEPLTRNPMVNLYRATLAPKIWKQITCYFGAGELEVMRRGFLRPQIDLFYLTGFLAFVWQFGIRWSLMFRLCLRFFGWVDKVLTGVFPGAARFAWFAVIRTG